MSYLLEELVRQHQLEVAARSRYASLLAEPWGQRPPRRRRRTERGRVRLPLSVARWRRRRTVQPAPC